MFKSKRVSFSGRTFIEDVDVGVTNRPILKALSVTPELLLSLPTRGFKPVSDEDHRARIDEGAAYFARAEHALIFEIRLLLGRFLALFSAPPSQHALHSIRQKLRAGATAGPR